MRTNLINGFGARQDAIESLGHRSLLTMLKTLQSDHIGNGVTYSGHRRDDAVTRRRDEARESEVHDHGATRSLRHEAGGLYDETFEGCETLSSKIQALHLM